LFSGGRDMVEPGLVPVMAWRPSDGRPGGSNAAYYWAGFARKP